MKIIPTPFYSSPSISNSPLSSSEETHINYPFPSSLPRTETLALATISKKRTKVQISLETRRMARNMLQKAQEHKEGRDMYAFAAESSQGLEKFKLNSYKGDKGMNEKYRNPVYNHRHKETFPDDEISTKRQGQLERQLNQYTHRVTEARNKHFHHGQRASHNNHRLVLQHNHHHNASGSGMRAVFLGGSESRSGSGGTGVFLPGGSGNVLESRRKSGCSTVLIPARVAQALKLHFEKTSSQSRQEGGILTRVKNDINSHENNNYEICLPEEWTY